MANSWYEQFNETAQRNADLAKARSANTLYGDQGQTDAWLKGTLKQAPSDIDQFRQSFGGGYANEADYLNWSNNRQRENTLSSFVDRMASPQNATMQNTFQGQVNDFGTAVKEQLAAPQPIMQQPVMNTSNRFEGNLSDSETRLNALLNNPTSALEMSPAYQFRRDQGEELLMRKLASKGLLNSGNRLQAITDYGQNTASQEYDAEYGRRKGLYDTNAGLWNTDKAANTARFGAESTAANQRFAAESTAANQRLGTLGTMLGQAGSNYNTGANIANNDRTTWGNIWTNQAPKAVTQLPRNWWQA